MTPTQFFHKHAGFSSAPATETEGEGRLRCARALAKAEAAARDLQFDFEWREDYMDSSEFSDEQPPWTLWICMCRDGSHKVVAALGGIDFGRDGSPWGRPYKRVVEAQLALEAI